MHLWSMYVLNRMQKKNNLMTKLTIVTSWKKTAQTMRETTRKSLLKHTLFGSFAKLISICIEFTILPGLPSTFKGFLSQSDFNSYSYQVSPSIFSGFWADFSVLSVRSSFCFRRCVAYGEALEWYHSSPRLSKSRAIRWPVMSRATEATTQHPLERSRRDPVELPTMRAKHIRTWSGDLVEQC